MIAMSWNEIERMYLAASSPKPTFSANLGLGYKIGTKRQIQINKLVRSSAVTAFGLHKKRAKKGWLFSCRRLFSLEVNEISA